MTKNLHMKKIGERAKIAASHLSNININKRNAVLKLLVLIHSTFYWNKINTSNVNNGVKIKGVINERKDNGNNNSNLCTSIVISSSIPR